MEERNRCEKTGNMGSFLTATATRFMGKFGYNSSSKGVTWDIAPVPGFEDTSAGSFVPNPPAATSGNSVRQTAGESAANQLNKAAVTQPAPSIPNPSRQDSNSEVNDQHSAKEPAPSGEPAGKDIPAVSDPATHGQEPAAASAGKDIPDTTDTSTVLSGEKDTAPTNPIESTRSAAANPGGEADVQTGDPAATATAGSSDSPSTTKQSLPGIGSIRGITKNQMLSVADSLGWNGLSEEEVESRKAAFASLRLRLQEYFAKEARKVENDSGSKLIETMSLSTGKKDLKPQRLADVQIFMKYYFDKVIRPEYNEEMAEAKRTFEDWHRAHPDTTNKDIQAHRPVSIAIKTRVAKRMLEEETEDFRQELREQVETDYQEQLKAWQGSTEVNKKSSSEKTAQDWGASLQRRWA
ncbi:hypothetical protein K435DRAFT_868234 [Dendrothele bispora CBS 962.96]|uniref:Uncharacterized protein n=1 Tax=Dendrothele bispora (strain CBS 962.96) TaxID=1314807 RepID=A0A4V4HDA7_DENBC|nr:hypothetical protein K435DRAFT_868234 [Dendrothele bispora CBS 962.96]